MAFSKITSAELLNKGVTGLDDTPALSVADMQAKFDELPNIAITKFNGLVDDLNTKLPNLTGVQTVVADDDTKLVTGGAIVKYVTQMGGGDMTKAIYDTGDTGVVDDAEKLGGELPAFYQKATDETLETTDKTITGAINELNSLETIDYGTCTNYLTNTTYDLGALVVYSNKLYKCITAITVGEVWDSSKWSAIADSKNGIVYNNTDLSFYGVRGADSVLKKLGEPAIIDCGSNTTINIANYYDGDVSSLTVNNFILAITNTSISGNNTGQLISPNTNEIIGSINPGLSYNPNTGIVSVVNTTGSFTSKNGSSYYVNVTVKFKVYLITN